MALFRHIGRTLPDGSVAIAMGGRAFAKRDATLLHCVQPETTGKDDGPVASGIVAFDVAVSPRMKTGDVAIIAKVDPHATTFVVDDDDVLALAAFRLTTSANGKMMFEEVLK